MNTSKLYVIPEYSFGAYCDGDIKLSSEHNEYKWVLYDEAIKYYDKVLNTRVTMYDFPGVLNNLLYDLFQ